MCSVRATLGPGGEKRFSLKTVYSKISSIQRTNNIWLPHFLVCRARGSGSIQRLHLAKDTAGQTVGKTVQLFSERNTNKKKIAPNEWQSYWFAMAIHSKGKRPLLMQMFWWMRFFLIDVMNECLNTRHRNPKLIQTQVITTCSLLWDKRLQCTYWAWRVCVCVYAYI